MVENTEQYRRPVFFCINIIELLTRNSILLSLVFWIHSHTLFFCCLANHNLNISHVNKNKVVEISEAATVSQKNVNYSFNSLIEQKKGLKVDKN